MIEKCQQFREEIIAQKGKLKICNQKTFSDICIYYILTFERKVNLCILLDLSSLVNVLNKLLKTKLIISHQIYLICSLQSFFCISISNLNVEMQLHSLSSQIRFGAHVLNVLWDEAFSNITHMFPRPTQ